jgi:hypothetical protein
MSIDALEPEAPVSNMELALEAPERPLEENRLLNML